MAVQTWMTDRREKSWRTVSIGPHDFHVTATPIAPGVRGYRLECLELPFWEGRCAYAYPDERDNAAFQFVMRSGPERDFFAKLFPGPQRQKE